MVLEHRPDLELEQPDGGGDGFAGELARRRPLQCVLAQRGDGGVLGGRALELGLGRATLGDVGQHAVPAAHAVGVTDEQRVVAQPHDVTVAVQDPVLDGPRGGAVGQLGAGLLAREHPGDVLGVQPGEPQLRPRTPLLGRIPEDRLDLGAHVLPGPVLAGLGGIEDDRDPLQQDWVIGRDCGAVTRRRPGVRTLRAV